MRKQCSITFVCLSLTLSLFCGMGRSWQTSPGKAQTSPAIQWAEKQQKHVSRCLPSKKSLTDRNELHLRQTIARLRTEQHQPGLRPITCLADALELKPRERQNLERNLTWIIARLSAKRHAKVAVYADAGVWHLGAKSVVESLEKVGINCQVFDRTCASLAWFKTYDAIIIPGGWGDHQVFGLGDDGINSIRQYVRAGGIYLGICAGAYLAAQRVVWEGKVYPYRLCLFDGTAEGSLANIAKWPKPAAVRATVTSAGARIGLSPAARYGFLYQGGPRFIGGTHVQLLATYPDGSQAVIMRPFGRGRVVLTGIHFERPGPNRHTDDPDRLPVPAISGKLFKHLLFDTSRLHDESGKRNGQ